MSDHTPELDNPVDAAAPDSLSNTGCSDPLEDPGQLLPFAIVGIGASAGGVEAYIELFRNLPAATGAAFVVVTHLARDQKSHLVEILSQHTMIPVRSLEDRTIPEPDRIYVLPPNALVTISAGVLVLAPRPEGSRAPMPINHFFRSLASDQKTRAIGVVLSGMDSDGATGLAAIKAEGGISIVQEPDSARFPSMPRSSIATDHVDLILPPARIASELARLVKSTTSPELHLLLEGQAPARDEDSMAGVFRLLRKVSGIDFSGYKLGTARRRIARRMIVKRIDTISEYLPYLQDRPDEVAILQEELLIGVTRFYRDPEVFAALKSEIFPGLFAAVPSGSAVRIWVAGCSSGEEVYSIAMCALEFLDETTRHGIGIQIFGTDASEHSIRKARTGIYPESVAADISPERLRKFFVKFDKGYQIVKAVRDICIFARHNLCNDPPYSRLDLVSCRNVLIYLNQNLQSRIIQTFHYSLRANGCLLLGRAESIRSFYDQFTTLDRKNNFYAKIPGSERSGFDLWRPVPFVESPPALTRAKEPAGVWSEIDLHRATDRAILARFDLPAIIVRENLEIVFTRGQVTPFLEIASGTPSLHLMSALRADIAARIRNAVERAIDDTVIGEIEGEIEVRDGQGRSFRVDVMPLAVSPDTDQSYLILFTPQSLAVPAVRAPSTPAAQELAPAATEGGEPADRLRRDLQSTKRYMQALIEDRDIRNEELTSASEEIQSQNEELQSANEELETTKEEIQSANEELQTVNDELQQRNDALAVAGNDLANLLASVNLPVLMLDNALQIRQFTPAAQRVMSIRRADIGRPLGEIRIHLSVVDLEPIVREVLDSLAAREIEVQDREQRWHLLRVRPYRTSENKIDGAILTLMDIDQFRRAQAELREARDFARAIITHVPVPLVVLDMHFAVRIANDAFRKLADLPTGIEGRSFPDFAVTQWEMRSLLANLEEIQSKGMGASFVLAHAGPSPDSPQFTVRGLVMQVEGARALLIIMEDVTLRNRAEALLTAESNFLKGQAKLDEIELKRTQEELRGLAWKLFTSQEEERRRVARELHDDITQKLAFLYMQLEELAGEIEDAQLRSRFLPLREQTAALSEDIRLISHGLHPSILDDLGLPIALKALIAEFGEREGMPASFHPGKLPDSVPAEVATALYRIAQEALRNVAKHAGKTHVKLSLDSDAESIRMEIVDFGVGFDVSEPRSGVGGGLGLISMAERARLVAGSVAIEPRPGRGVSVRVSVPVHASGG